MNTHFLHIADAETQPLPLIATKSFQVYLAEHGLTIRDVARASHVRLMVIWNILHGRAILSADAGRVRAGLFLLTRECYSGAIAVRAEAAPTRMSKERQFARVS